MPRLYELNNEELALIQAARRAPRGPDHRRPTPQTVPSVLTLDLVVDRLVLDQIPRSALLGDLAGKCSKLIFDCLEAGTIPVTTVDNPKEPFVRYKLAFYVIPT